MKVSFVIPAYNEEACIGACLGSIQRELARTPCDTEVIVVNNASTDRTAEIARSFSGVRVVDEPTKGLVHARHAGFVASTGTIIANLDSDTMLPQGWLRYVLTSFERRPQLAVLSGPFIYYDAPVMTRWATALFYRLGFVSYLVNRFLLRVGSMVQGGNFIVRRTALEQAGGFDRTITFYGEDTDIARRLHRVGDVVWTFQLPIYASGRRLMKEGLLTMGVKYGINYFWTLFAKRPFSNSEPYHPIR